MKQLILLLALTLVPASISAHNDKTSTTLSKLSYHAKTIGRSAATLAGIYRLSETPWELLLYGKLSDTGGALYVAANHTYLTLHAGTTIIEDNSEPSATDTNVRPPLTNRQRLTSTLKILVMPPSAWQI